MKKSIILFSFMLCFLAGRTQSNGVPDTLVHLQSLVANKAQYVGKPFSMLKADLLLDIKYFFSVSSIPHRKDLEIYTYFAFYYPSNRNELYLTYPRFEIKWLHPLNADQSFILWKNNNGGGWTNAVANFYQHGIIADIKIEE